MRIQSFFKDLTQKAVTKPDSIPYSLIAVIAMVVVYIILAYNLVAN